MAETETKATEQQTEQQQDNQQQPEPEKKYTDAEVNNISKKNSDKAVAKLLKELGIDATDEGKAAAKDIIAKAKAEAAKDKPADKPAEDNGKFEAAMQKIAMAQGTIALIGRGVPAEKAARFAKLLDLSGAVDEAGEIDEEGMGAAVDALLKDWPEALGKAGDKVGFKIGSDGKETKDNAEDTEMEKWRKEARLKK